MSAAEHLPADGDRTNGRRDVDRVLVGLLAQGVTLSDAAKALGCSLSTIRRRADEPEIRAAVERERTRVLDGLRGQLLDAGGIAVINGEPGEDEYDFVTIFCPTCAAREFGSCRTHRFRSS